MFADVVDLSRFQFASTALYHFIFVPLTIGLSFLLAVMESLYVMTGKTIYKDMTKFWGKLFGINFAVGVATGLTMEFQFGTNWAYYSHYVGRYFRGTACHRSLDCLLPRIYLSRHVLLRLGSIIKTPTLVGHLADSARF